MPSTHLLLKALKSDFPQFTFLPANQTYWNPDSMTVFYDTYVSYAELLHELAHALLGHTEYRRDIELIEIERDAWNHAIRQLAPMYDVVIDREVAETALDSYRDWLHVRSACPECAAIGIQSTHQTYRCLACRSTWRVNEAKTCALRRYKISPQ